MKTFVATVALMALTASRVDTSCMTWKGPCLNKEQVDGFDSFFEKGNPCFQHGDDKRFPTYCFWAQGQLVNCDATKPECTDGSGSDATTTTEAPKCTEPVTSATCTAQQEKYCADALTISPWPNPHIPLLNTLCKYCGVSADCGSTFCFNGLTAEDKVEIVDKHNALRRTIAKGNAPGQPEAKNMYELTWDDELAKGAQMWADQCPNGAHDKNRVIEGFAAYPYVGQNMADSWSSVYKTDKTLSDKIMAWYNEVNDFPTKNPVTYGREGVADDKVIGHYTQLAWGSSTRIGCGFMAYVDTSDFAKNYKYRQTLVCNYAKGGNSGSDKLYDIGTAGTGCGANGQDDGLCKA